VRERERERERLAAVARELAEYDLDLVGVQVVRYENHELGRGFFVHERLISAVKRVENARDAISYIIPRGHWCDITVRMYMPHWRLKLLTQRTTSCEELEHLCDKFPKYCMNMLGDFSAKLTIQNQSLYEISNDNELE
jgi:hypothetical protein